MVPSAYASCVFGQTFANFNNVNVLYVLERVENENAHHLMVCCFYCFESEIVNEFSQFEKKLTAIPSTVIQIRTCIA